MYNFYTENEVDGAAFLVITESHLEKMLPNKIGVVLNMIRIQKVCDKQYKYKLIVMYIAPYYIIYSAFSVHYY